MMKYFTVQFLIVCLLAVSATRFSFASEGLNAEPSLHIESKVSRTTIYPYEPLTVLTSLQNATNQTKTYTSTWYSGVAFRRESENSWHDNMRFRFAATVYPSEKKFTAGHTEYALNIIGSQITGRHAFPVPGAYFVKSYLGDWETDLIAIKVADVLEQDRDAIVTLSQTTLYRYFSDTDAFATIEDTAPEISREKHQALELEFNRFIKDFPKSRYSQWARMGLLLSRAVGVMESKALMNSIRNLIRQNKRYQSLFEQQYGKGTVTRALEDNADSNVDYLTIQQELEKLAPQLSAPINARCWMAAGRIAQMRRDDAAAKADFEKAIATKAEATLQDEVDIRLKNPMR
jgi:hypothetical protein